MWTLNLSFSVAFSVNWYLAPSEFWCPQLCNVLWLTSFATFGIIVNTKNKILNQQLISRNYPSHAKLLACLELEQQKLIKVIKTLPKNTTSSKSLKLNILWLNVLLTLYQFDMVTFWDTITNICFMSSVLHCAPFSSAYFWLSDITKTFWRHKDTHWTPRNLVSRTGHIKNAWGLQSFLSQIVLISVVWKWTFDDILQHFRKNS